MTNQEKVDGIVYKATSPSGKVYIGITITSLNERKRTHLRSVRKGSELPFHNAIKKYKMKNIKWEIIDRADTWNELCALEAKYIEEYDSHRNGYNLTLGGEGTFGLKHSEEWCNRDSERRKRFFQDPQNRKIQSLANQRAHDSNPTQGIEHSKFMKERYEKKSEREKTAEGMKNFLADSTHRRIHSIQRGAKTFLVHKEDGEFVGEWLIQRECARDLNLDFSHINTCLHGKRKSHGGYVFKYKDGK